MRQKKSPSLLMGFSFPAFARTNFNLGDVLLSRTVTHAVPSALEGLTSVFGMGTGVTPSPWSPRNFFKFEARNPKFETIPNFLNPNVPNKMKSNVSKFEFRICFGFRYSDFEFLN